MGSPVDWAGQGRDGELSQTSPPKILHAESSGSLRGLPAREETLPKASPGGAGTALSRPGALAETAAALGEAAAAARRLVAPASTPSAGREAPSSVASHLRRGGPHNCF